MASPTLVGTPQHARATATGGAGLSATLTVPAATQVGDLMVVFCGADYTSGQVPGAPSVSGGSAGAWTTIEVNTDTSNLTSTAWVAKFATAADIGATLTVTYGPTTSGSNSLPLYALEVWHGAAGFPKFTYANWSLWYTGGATGSGTTTATHGQDVVETNSTVVSFMWASTWNNVYPVTTMAGNATVDDNYVSATGGGMGLLVQHNAQAAAGTVTAQTASATASGADRGRYQYGSMVLHGIAPSSAVGWRSTAGAANAQSITVPLDVQVGDLMVVSYLDGTAQQTPAGWTQLVHDTTPGINSTVWAKVAAAGDIGATVTFGANSAGLLTFDAFYNWGTYNSTSLTSVLSGDHSQTTGATSITSPAGSAPMANSVAYQAWTMQINSPSSTVTVPNAQIRSNGLTTNNGEAISYQIAAAGTLPTQTLTCSVTLPVASCIQLVITPVAPPLAPTLNTPANSTTMDLSGTVPTSWTPNPTLNDGAQNAVEFRRKISGGPSYSYWNPGSSTFQSTGLYFAQTPDSYTFPAGSWANGNIYNWNVSTQESVNGGQSPFAASDFTVTGQGPPVVAVTAPTGTISTATPTVSATITPYAATGAAITGARGIIYTEQQVNAPGFTAGTTPGVYDTGSVAISTSPFTFTVPANYLTNGVYYAYVEGTETAGESAWGSAQFSVSFDAPAQPTVTATPVAASADGTVGPAALVTVTGHDNLVSAVDASFETGVGDWAGNNGTTVSASTAMALDGSQSLAMVPTQGGTTTGWVPGAKSPAGASGYAVTGGANYVLIGAYKAGSTARGTGVKINWYDSSGTYLSASTSAVITDASAYWSFDAATVTAPTGAAYAQLVALVYEPNMLTANDSSFEGGNGNWGSPSNCTLSNSTAQAKVGTHSLALTATAAGDMSTQNAPGTYGWAAVAGTAYTAQVWFRAAATPRNVYVGISWWTSAGAAISTTWGSVYTDNTTGWSVATVTGIAPSNAAGAGITAVVQAAAAGEVHYLDCAMLTAKTVPGQRYPGDTVTAPGWAGINPNLLDNGDFEVDLHGWTSTSAGDIPFSRVTSGAHTGLAAMQIASHGGYQWQGVYTLTIPTVNGQSYTYSAWVYLSSGPTQWRLSAYDGNGNFLAGTVFTPTGTWQRITVTFTANSSGAILYFQNSTTVASTILVDAVKLEAGASATQFVPPSYSNMLYNPALASNASGWSSYSTASQNNDPSMPSPISGGGAVKIVQNAGGIQEAGISQSVLGGLMPGPFGPGTTVTYSAWVLYPSGAPHTMFRMYARSEQTNNTWGFSDVTGIPTGAWQRVTATFTVPAGQTLDHVYFVPLETGGNGILAASEVAWLADVQLEYGWQANPYVDGSTAGGTWDVSGNLYTANQASFEDGTADGWTGNAGTTVANSTAQAMFGTHSLAVTVPANTAAGAWLVGPTDVPTVAGAMYTVSLWVYSTIAQPLAVYWGDNTTGQVIGPSLTVPANTWTRLSAVGPLATSSSSFIGLRGSSTSASTIYVDGAQFEQREYPTAFDSVGTGNQSSATYNYPWDIVGDTHYLDEVGLFPGDTLGYRLQVLSDQPSAYWPLDDAVGSATAANVVKSGDGTVNGTVTFGQAGPVASDQIQTVALFNGSSYIDASVPAVSTTCTLEAWIKTSQTTPNQYCFLSNRSGPGAYYFGVRSGQLFLYNNGALTNPGTTGGAPCDGNWHHCAAVLTPTGATLYVDGVQVTAVSYVSAAGSSGQFRIGGDVPDGATEDWLGDIAHVAVYPTALSAARVLAHYQAAKNTAGKIVQRWTRGGLASGQQATVWRSVDGGQTWTALRAGTTAMVGQVASFTDYECPTGIPVEYEAMVTSPAQGISSTMSEIATVTIPSGTFVWVHDPTQPDIHTMLNLLTSMSASVGGVSGVGYYALQHEETETVDYALGRSDPVVQHGDQHDPTFELAWIASYKSDYTNFMALRARKRTLCFRFRDGSVLYATTGGALVDLVLRPPDGTVDPTTMGEGVVGQSTWQPRALQTTMTAGAVP